MRSIRVPRDLQHELSEEARWVDAPRGSEWVTIESRQRAWSTLTATAICFLPWNRPRRPV